VKNIFSRWFRKPDKWIAVDVELDGMHPSHIIQLSYLVIEGRRIKGKNFYFPARNINRYARKVHGLSVGMLKDLSQGKTFEDHMDEIYRDFQDCKLVIGHDVGGDIRYIRRDFQRYGLQLPNYPTFCTLKHYTEEAHIPLKQNPKVLKPPRLEELCNHFGLTQEFIAARCQKWYGGGDHYHDARFDAAAAYLCMMVGEKMG
jgi:DNA polymerase-3 subunit epsilon